MYGNQLKEQRKLRNITQMELSKGTGLPQSTISWLENDEGIPNIQQCIIISQFYGITVDELLEETKKPL